jgi:ComF family protein
MLTQLLTDLYYWALPPTCILCQQRAQQPLDICLPCYGDLPWLKPGCPCCATPQTDRVTACGKCQQDPPPFTRALALFHYEPPITQLLLGLKFHSHLLYARVLGEIMAKQITQHWYKQKALPQILIPMPLHRQRLTQRGFNQALELARPIAKICKIPLDIKHCLRPKATLAQAQLKAAARKKNMQNAFTTNPYFAGKHVAILDDIMTTGLSLRSLALSLQQAGAQRIDVWCVARAFKPRFGS